MLLLIASALMAAEPWPGTVTTAPSRADDLDLPLPAGGTAAVRVFHPADGAGPWPVIVFSHGLGGSRESYGVLGRRWADHGYVVVAPNHPGSDTDAVRAAGARDALATLRAATTDPKILEGRPRLIAAVIDALPALEQALPALAGKLDREHLGVAGHSFGGWTTMCVAGMRVRLGGPEARDLSDKRPIAFIALSPPGPSATTRPDDFAACTRPLLVMTGSEDKQPSFLSPPGVELAGDWRRQVFDRSPARDKLLAWFEGGRHSTFGTGKATLLSGDPEPDPHQVAAVGAVTLAWWDARLRADAKARTWLEDPGTPATLGSWARFERK